MKTLKDLHRHLQATFDQIDGRCRHGAPDSYTGLDATQLAEEAQRLAYRFGYDAEMTPTTTAHEALRLVGRLIAWADALRTKDRPLTVPEVATFLRVRPDKVLSWVRSGRLRGYNVAEKEKGRPKYRVNREDLESFVQQRAVTQPAPKVQPAGHRQIPMPKWKPRS
jgi:excisionase family DNA binding protein